MPPSLEDLRALIDAALAQELDRSLARLATDDASLAPVGAAIREFLGSGKRIRPMLLLLGYRAGGGTDPAAVLGPALAMELLHTCALVHDDVIDRAGTRRGNPTVHEHFAGIHRASGWRGDSAAYGDAVAILVGDLAFVYADELFFRTTVDAATAVTAFVRFTRLREEVMAGQYLDVHGATIGTEDRARVERIATLKSGRYSVARPLEVGALLAGADATLVAGLGAFGDPIGRAFQVRDDLLGLFGDEDTTGKSASSDLAEGKRTLLIVEALERLDPDDADELRGVLGTTRVAEEDLRRARSQIQACGAVEAAEAYIESALNDGFAALHALPVDDETSALLTEMAASLGFRSR